MPSVAISKSPLVSIGIPVFNEARYLGDAIASLLAQDYPQIEFIISDNASTDSTLEICQRAAESDCRIRVLGSEANQGSAANFVRCLNEAKGDFFMWAGGHDLWSDNFVSDCVKALEAHSGAVIAVPESRWVDASSMPFGEHASMLDTRGMQPLARIFTLLWANMHPIYGLIRTAALRESLPMPNVSGADLILLARLILRGDFVPAHNAVWSRRQTRSAETYRGRQQRYHGSQFKISKPVFPLVRLACALLKTVWSSSLTVPDKFAFTLAFPGLLPARYLVARQRIA